MKYNWNKEKLESTVNNCNCWMEWLRALEIPTSGCNYRTLKNKALIYKIDTSHFNYVYAKTHNGKRLIKNKTNKEIFNSNVHIHRDTLKRAYIDRVLQGIPHCENCGIKNWNNKPIIFQLHHINGDSKDHSIENLKLLCPNCHSQTENFSNKKR